jgi:hypothetical protein
MEQDPNYHGTSALNADGIDAHGLEGDGDGRVYFTGDLEDAQTYARNRGVKDGTEGVVFSFDLKPGVEPRSLGDGSYVDESEIDRSSVKRVSK